ncbi:hypothetical protein C9374_011488 [Naegleria lovaniensis]|uniref:RNA helicase n=1 Tax=Naegleria lovaniensis TaxID=51637 RepID=A0AA88GXC9_NAELO|nr:uncharacterized protein C9374_011488 [Naegleria lovaniensis]KAG2392763.1 hypothetical protein C9374_011488 [Naegleria lovaniensis]
MERLLELQLVSKVCKELETNIGSGEKALAEFVIYLAREESKNVDDFYNKLIDNDAELPRDFVERLYAMIHRMSNSKLASSSGNSSSADGKFTSAGQFSVSSLVKSEEKVSGDGLSDNKQKEAVTVSSDQINDRLHSFDKSIKEEMENNLRRKLELTKKFPSLCLPDKSTVYSSANEKTPSDKKDTFDRKDTSQLDRYDSKSQFSDKSLDSRSSRFSNDDRNRNAPGSSSSADGSSSRRNAKREYTDTIEVNQIYKARVSGIKNYGFFARLEETIDGVIVRGNKDGLCHISEISNEKKVTKVDDVVSRNDIVFVKVIVATESRVSLSMKEVDQQTGKDLFPRRALAKNMGVPSREEESKLLTHHSGISPAFLDTSKDARRPVKKQNPYDMWEEKQLRASGMASEGGVINEETGEINYDEVEEDVEIELSEKEPKFLSGQTMKGGMAYSPVRLTQVRDGTLARIAEKQLEFAQERREIKEEQKAKLQGDMADLEADDPLSEYYRRINEATDFSGMKGFAGQGAPDWRKTAISGVAQRTSASTIKQQRESLPVYSLRNELITSIRDNQILIVIGETGSGKTTQITQYIAEAGINGNKMIACTQPRRVAAISVARRVAEEFGCKLGQEVGYTIRFEDCTSPDTVLKYMTDGMLLREALLDPLLEKYSVIMLDEAHERNLHTDVLFALLKKLTQKRKDLKLIVTSATLDAEKFSTYFYTCPIFTIPGRTYPVEILYTKEPEEDYLDATLITVMQIHLTEPAGDILVFLTGQEEIDTACQILYERMKALGSDVPELVILPIYAALPSEMQTKIFEPAPVGGRKVVIATNIAETSITIDGIFYVVDPGFVKQNIYNPKTGMDQLTVVPISQAAARQRAGRAGRTGPGKCYRLYTEEAYKSEMLPNTVPEIQRTNLANTVLTLKAMGINDLLNFDFMDPPPPQSLIAAMEQLFSLGALDDDGLLTKMGRKMAEFPLEPQMAKTLIASVDLKCSDEVLTIVSMLSVQGIFYRPRDKQQQADQKKSRFFQPEGDHLTLLSVYQAWERSNYSIPWCFENFIQARSMKRAQDIRKQLLTIMDRYKLNVISCGKNYTKVRKAITSGFFAHASKKDPQEGYRTLVENQPVYIHPGSAIFHRNPEWVIYHTLLLTSKEYMRDVITIEPKWLIELAPNFYKVHDPAHLSKRKRQEKIEPLFNKYGDDPLQLLKRTKR